MLKILITASNPVEQSLLPARLSDAGIPCMRGPGGARAALGSARGILVEEEDLPQALEILKEDDQRFDEEELARLSEEAGRKVAEVTPMRARPTPRDHVDSPTGSESEMGARTHNFLKAFERFTVDRDKTKSPFGR